MLDGLLKQCPAYSAVSELPIDQDHSNPGETVFVNDGGYGPDHTAINLAYETSL
jgi:hypothetical protein